ncbi:MAG: CCA tRNA nucleotidyltransferase [Candidatus Vogelbacteria bacterium]|nr:CCA tRNA nucleotidyltransferase [Candidatus Vogelbacteria bacterium]
MFKIPPEVSHVTETLQGAGFQAFLVGGCVRDLIIGREPKDWDITTNAKPEEIQALFVKTFYENDYGTVGIVNEASYLSADRQVHETLKIIEVTPFRLEGKYSDFRHPGSVIFSTKLEDDLKRRDFTINAVAYDPRKGQLIDPYKGQVDIKDRVIKAVGNPQERFKDDALRLMRAVRLSTDLEFSISKETADAIEASANLLSKISVERVKDELSKIIMTGNPMQGIILCHRLGLLEYIIPEVEEGIGLEQNGDHIYDIWEHNLRALNHSADRGWPLHVRLSALLHDVGKPRTRVWSKEKDDWTFYGHDVVGGRMADKILTRLKYPSDIVETVVKLVRYHLFFSDIDKITLSAVRRIVKNVGPDNVWDLMKVRACDRIGMGRPKETPYRLRKYESMIEEAMRSPVSVGMLKIDGQKIKEAAGLSPGPKIGFILHALLEEVLDDPGLNTEEYLNKKARELSLLSESDLKTLGDKGKEAKIELEEKELGEIRKKYHVK